MRRFLIIAIMTMFTLSLFGGCLIRTNARHGHSNHPSKVRCGKGYVKVKHKNGKWKCKKKKKAKKVKTRDHR